MAPQRGLRASPSRRIHSVSQCVRAFRDEIALCVINEAKRLHPNAIEFHFNSLIQNVDLDRQTAHVSTGSHVTEVRYDAL